MAIEQDDRLRQMAVERLKKRSEFGAHLLAYVLVNAFLVAIWVMSDSGFFWPIFLILGWGIGVVFNAWDVYRRPPTEERIRREIENLKTHGA
jgi:hypothetical protein